MRWLVLIGVVGCVACTRMNPSYGDGGTEHGDDEASDPSGDASVSVGEDAEASADDVSSVETGVQEDSAEETGASRPCCFAHGGLGCEDRNIEDCVCSYAADCCEVEWNEDCVYKARNGCSAECFVDEGPFETSDTFASTGTTDGDSSGSSTTMSEGSSTGGSTGEAVSACCSAQDGPGCGDTEIENCVCVTNRYPGCCNDLWDLQCATVAAECSVSCG